MKPGPAITSLVLAAAMMSATPGIAKADAIELGTLECYVDAGTGFIFGSTKDISCVFTSASDETIEDNYFGAISKFGIDIGSTDESYISWLVVTQTDTAFERGFLQGDYAGATASASFAVGLGANVLVGGSDESFALQPLSVEAQTGFNVAAGIAEIELRSIVD